MRSIKVDLPAGSDITLVVRTIELLCAKEGLVQKSKRSLKSYSGSTHWHYNRELERGTLEITLWPSGSRVFFSVHDNRRGLWTDEYAARLARATRNALKEPRRANALRGSFRR